MAKQNKIRNIEKRKVELVRDIETCRKYREEIDKFVCKINYKYDNCLITREEYDRKLSEVLGEKTPKQWEIYYKQQIRNYKHEITLCNRDIQREKNRKTILPVVAILVIFLVMGWGLYVLNTQITGLVVQEDSITFDRLIDCDRCGQHKVPSMAEVNMTITAEFIGVTENDTLSDYFNKEWTILDPSEGIIEDYNENYSKISWTVDGDEGRVSRTYSIKSPALTSPPTEYYFWSGLKITEGDPWRVIVADPDIELTDSAFAFADDPIAIAGTTTLTGDYKVVGGDGWGGTVTVEVQGGATITDACSSNEIKLTSCALSQGSKDELKDCCICNADHTVTCTNCKRNDDGSIILGIEGCSGGTSTYITRVTGGLATMDVTDSLTVNAVNNDYPVFNNYAVNETLLKLNEYAKFNVSITDASDSISYANGTINEVTYGFIQNGDEWYYEWECTSSDSNVDFTYIGANDTGTPSNWNSTIISGVSVECDAAAPIILNAEINNTSPVALNTVVKVNASITDTESNLNITILEVIPPTTLAYNVTPTQNGNEFYNDTIILTEAGQWQFRFYANDTAGNDATLVLAQDQALNNYIEVTIPNQDPVIVNISDIPDQSITEASVSNVEFSVLASDNNGVGELNDTSLNATFSRTGETTRYNLSCLWISDINATTANYSCSVGIWYWDGAGTWDINVAILDTNDAQSDPYNETFTLLETTAMVMSPTSLGWPTLYSGETNKLSDSDPIVINNTGNDDIDSGNVRVKAINLLGEENPVYSIAAANFTVNINDACEGTQMQNNTAIGISGSILQAGNNSEGLGQEDLYFCLEEVPIGIISQAYSTQELQDWVVDIQ